MTWHAEDEQLRQLLRQMDAADRDCQPPADLVRRALAAFDRRSTERVWRVRRSPMGWSRQTRLQWAGVAAAIVVVVGGLVVSRKGSPVHEVPAKAAQAEAPGAEAPRTRVTDVADGLRDEPSRLDAAVRLPEVERPGPPASVETAPEVGAFLALGPTSEDELGGALQLMRVRIRGSALRAFGVPLEPFRDERHFQADVLIGEDGMARAIRFVRDE